jgi:vacuolar-type H+-ATPase subunit H
MGARRINGLKKAKRRRHSEARAKQREQIAAAIEEVPKRQKSR